MTRRLESESLESKPPHVLTQTLERDDPTVTTEQIELAKSHYLAGKDAFERGQYRQSAQSLEKAIGLVSRGSRLGGEMQIWLVTAYEALGQQAEAIALCEQLSRHPDFDTRKQGRRLLYILKAPRLQIRPEWMTQIPDLGSLEDSEQGNKGMSRYANTPKQPRKPRAKPELEPIDWSQINTQDNRFVWVALGAIILILGSLAWLS